MISTLLRLLFVTSLWCCATLQAQPVGDPLAREQLPLAAKARAGVVEHPRLAAFEYEATVRDAVQKARDALKNTQDFAAARAILRGLEEPLGPLREIPYVPLHFLLGDLAKAQANVEEEKYHRAYATALLVAMTRSGQGEDALSAIRVVMVREEYEWFAVMQSRLKPKARVYREIDGHGFDVWTAIMTAGGEREVYFDVGPMQASLQRVFAARKAAPPSLAR
jgi:hypothetical protein